MTTNAEALATAYPLHYQRIVEASYEYDLAVGDRGHTEAWLREKSHCAWCSLMNAMAWSRTSEGFEYWMSLAEGQCKSPPIRG